MTFPVVVPLDGSVAAEHALVHAIGIARALGSALHLVRVSTAGTSTRGPWLNPQNPGTDVVRFIVDERAREQAYLDAIARRIRQEFAFEDVATALLDGPVAKAIVRYSRRQNAGTVVMTTHGSSGIGAMPLGTVAEMVACLAGLPVLLVRPNPTDTNAKPNKWRCERILMPLDGSELAQSILAHVTVLGLGAGAQVTLVTVVNPAARIDVGSPSAPLTRRGAINAGARAAETHLTLVAQRLHHEGLRVATRVVYGGWPEAEAINAVARDVRADMIAIATRTPGRAMRRAFGSVAGSLLRNARMPVLLFRPLVVSNEGLHQDSVAATEPNIEQPMRVLAATGGVS